MIENVACAKTGYIVANRTDGLGVRLMALLNAIALSKILNIPFKFTWDDNKSNNEFHTVSEVSEIFGTDFVEEHYIDSVKAMNKVSLTELVEKGGEGNFYECPQSLSGDIRANQDILKKMKSVDFGSIFSDINFSKKITFAIDLALNAVIPDSSTALHLRAGDVVYGGFRRSGYYVNKVIPYPIAVDLINANNNVVVFAQDESIINSLGSEVAAIFSKELVASVLSPLQRAFFDIVLMSRCGAIYAGRSGFSIVSSMISNIRIKEPVAVYSDEKTIEIIGKWLNEKNYEHVSKQQVAFSIISLVTAQRKLGWVADTLKLTEHGLLLDADNMYFVLLKLVALFESESYENADEFFLSLSDIQIKNLIDVVKMNYSLKVFGNFIEQQRLDIFYGSGVECFSYSLIALMVTHFSGRKEFFNDHKRHYYNLTQTESEAVSRFLRTLG